MVGSLRAWAGALALLATGCVVAVGTPPDVGGIYYTKRGAETVVAVPVARAFWAGNQAMAEMGIHRSEAELEREEDEDGEETEGEIEGRRADLKLKVALKGHRRGPTRVRVTAKREGSGWDRDLARRVLTRVVVLAH